MAINPNDITDKTFIDIGFPITPNFILEHFTSGAISQLTGKIIPQLPTNVFTQRFGNTPLFSIVKNLSASGISVIEPILSELGGSMIIRQAYSMVNAANEVRHMFGGGFDITIAGFENDLAYITKDIQKIAAKAESITLNYGSSSWIHLDINPAKLVSNWSSTKVELPSITTVDLVNNITTQGIYAMRSSGSQSIDLTPFIDDTANAISNVVSSITG